MTRAPDRDVFFLGAGFACAKSVDDANPTFEPPHQPTDPVRTRRDRFAV